MAEYYFMSQLPSLDGVDENTPIPIAEERFADLCQRFLDPKTLQEISRLTLVPPREYEGSSSKLLEAWYQTERELRIALAKVRADKMKKPFDAENKQIAVDVMKAARTAVESESPMEAERSLNNYRMEALELLRPTNSFSRDAVFYYGLKLKLLSRMKRFDAEVGEAAYKNIYHSIMSGEKSEAIQ